MTPIPWHIEKTSSDELGVDICAGDSRTRNNHTWIASVNGTHDNSEGFPKTTEECLANASFIVRACNAHNELLEIAKIVTTMACPGHGEFRKRARQAIARAEAKS